MDGISIREFEPSDYSALALIHDSLFPNHPLFPQRVKYEDSCYGQTRYRMKRLVAETESGMGVGFGEYKHLFFSYHPRKFALGIEVHPDWQRRGIGQLLYEQLMEELARIEAQAVWSEVLLTSTPAIAFLRKRGFVEKRKIIESILDLETLDSTKFAGLGEKLRSEGVTINSFSSEMRADQSAGRRLMDLEESAAGDVPNITEGLPMTFHDYEIIILNSSIMLWDGSFIAKHGEIYVGSSSLLQSGLRGMVEQGFTAVRPGYRGRDIAQALKLQVAMHAKNQGAKYIRAHNDSENSSMLAVNRKIGFVNQAEWITFQKEIA
jgi:ribosomal protein S18 acetylase RimI-like enzyme